MSPSHCPHLQFVDNKTNPPSTSGSPKTSLQSLLSKSNELFLNNYSKTKEAKISQIRDTPLIICSDKMRLYLNQESWEQGRPKEEASFTCEWYQFMKVMDHVPLNIFAILSREFVSVRSDWHTFANKSHKLTDSQRTDLKQCCAVCEDLMKTLREQQKPFENTCTEEKCLEIPEEDYSHLEKLPTEHVDRQLFILQTCIDFIQILTRDGHYTAHQFRSSLSSVLQSSIEDNITLAAQTQLKLMENTFKEWQDKYSHDLVRTAHVLIQSSHFAARENIILLFFQKLLDVKEESSQRILVTETSSPSTWKELLGTSIADTQVSYAFFDNGHRMHQDLLSPAAKANMSKMNL